MKKAFVIVQIIKQDDEILPQIVKVISAGLLQIDRSKLISMESVTRKI